MKRIRTLDGLRGLAITLVVAGHVAVNYPGLTGEVRDWLECLANAGMGVRLFFVLSGYLITRLMIEELGRNGGIDLAAFYRRRAVRILPAFYVFLIIAAVWGLFFSAGTTPLQLWLASASFTWNYTAMWTDWSGVDAWNLGHTWSLAVEAQFYLLWPAMFMRLQPRQALLGVVVLFALMPFIRVGSYALFPATRGYLGMMLHTGADGLLAGCASALALQRPDVRDWLQRHAPALIAAALAWVLVLGPVAVHEIRGFSIVAGFSLDAIAAALLVTCLDVSPTTVVARIFGRGLLPALGLISYSLYLWQQIFLHPDGWISGGNAWAPVLAALGVSIISYRMIERPFLRGFSRPKCVAGQSDATHVSP
jgi:peptidoglycan/LPS O-acetylase OafA/YrhL